MLLKSIVRAPACALVRVSVRENLVSFILHVTYVVSDWKSDGGTTVPPFSSLWAAEKSMVRL